VIDRTEAMTVIDVNTGKYTGAGGNLEETVTRNNLEAAEEIVRQLRLRDLGGIIVIDFIDMVLESNRELVLRRLTECLGRDRTKHQVTEITSLGLVQMTRKRVGQGLLEAFSETCEVCKGRGLIIHTEPVADRRGGDRSGVAKVAAATVAQPGSAEAAEPAGRAARRRGRRGGVAAESVAAESVAESAASAVEEGAPEASDREAPAASELADVPELPDIDDPEAEVLGVEPLEVEPLDVEPLDAEPLDVEPLDGEPLEAEAEPFGDVEDESGGRSARRPRRGTRRRTRP
jgi:ribonuclease E